MKSHIKFNVGGKISASSVPAMLEIKRSKLNITHKDHTQNGL